MTAKIHRTINTTLFVVIIGVMIAYNIVHQHDIEDCEARLYEKITGQKAPDVKDNQ